MKQTIITIVISILATLVLVLGLNHTGAVNTGDGIQGVINYVSTSTAISVSSATSTRLLASGAARVYAIFTNNGTSTVFISIGSPALANRGITLFASSSYDISQKNLYIGQVNAIAASGTPLVTVFATQ